jgi:glycerol-3-phosphate acyltransferase PlsY
LNILLSIAVSYAVGSVSPAFILGKIMGKVDIRAQGDGNAGTLNTAATLGIVPGLITGLFDISKGILSLFMSRQFLGLEGNLLLIPIGAAHRSISSTPLIARLCLYQSIGICSFFLFPPQKLAHA